MKRLRSGLMLALTIAVTTGPVIVRAQDAAPKTRAQVNAELAALERAGYHPDYSQDPDYPYNLQAAERKVAAEQTTTTQYGSSTSGSSASGSR